MISTYRLFAGSCNSWAGLDTCMPVTCYDPGIFFYCEYPSLQTRFWLSLIQFKVSNSTTTNTLNTFRNNANESIAMPGFISVIVRSYWSYLDVPTVFFVIINTNLCHPRLSKPSGVSLSWEVIHCCHHEYCEHGWNRTTDLIM